MDWLKSNCAFSSETMRSVSPIPLSADALEAFIYSVPSTLMTSRHAVHAALSRLKTKVALRAKERVLCIVPAGVHRQQDVITELGGHRGQAGICLWFHDFIPLKFMR